MTCGRHPGQSNGRDPDVIGKSLCRVLELFLNGSGRTIEAFHRSIEMDPKNAAELQCQLEQATRLASSVYDPTTVERFRAFIEERRRKLVRLLSRDRPDDVIRARAREQHGRPSGRDEEFWLQAERELNE